MTKPMSASQRELSDAYVCLLKQRSEMPTRRIAELMGISEPEVIRLIQLAEARRLKIDPHGRPSGAD